MFKVGDTVFYPAHGVGIIDDIEEKSIDGKITLCYKFHLINNPMTVVIPVENADNNNVRLISDNNTMNYKLNCIYSDNDEEFKNILNSNYKLRKEIFMNKILNGTVDDYLNVIMILTKLKGCHNLNSSEYQILYKAKKILCEEISISLNLSKNEADMLLDNVINN